MEYKSIFDFLKNDERFDDAYQRCIDVEKIIITKSDQAPFSLARVASEAFIIIVAKSNPELYNKYFKNDVDYSYGELLRECKTRGLISGRIYKKYKKLKNWGNSTIHLDENIDFLDQYKKDHRYLFDVSKHCYNIFHDEELIYEYYLDNYDYRIETYDEERNRQIKNVRFNEVDTEILIQSFKSKDIFIPIIFINTIIESYKDEIIDENLFNNDIRDYEFIDDENLDIFLDYFQNSVRSDVENSIKELNDNLSKGILKTINDMNKPEFTFNELKLLIENSKDSNQKTVYTYIKALAEDLTKKEINEYKKEIENSPITQFAQNGRKLLTYKNYKVVEDDFGFSLEEVDENIFLDDDQKKAVEYDGDKPLVINAGPGSGKTRVIIERVVHLIKRDKNPVDPSTILVITFTRKATQELRERLLNETDLDIKDINKIRISTVHGFCRYLIAKYEPIPYNYLTRHGERSLFFKKHKFELGFKKYAFLYDPWIPGILKEYDKYFSFKIRTDKLVNIIKNTIAPYEKHYKSPNNRYKRYIDDFYENHDLNENPNWKFLQSKKYNTPSYYYRWLNVAESYPKFLELMEDSSSCDDNTVLTKANSILENELILSKIQYKNILIDEFQDTDHNQMEIFEKLLKIANTFTIVGDADQSIYGWRGAFPEYFEQFREKDVKCVTLHTNYRSSRNIVEFNEELIKEKRSYDKKLKSKKKYHAPIYHLTSKTIDDEASRIVTLINNLKNDGKIKYFSDVAVLFRRNKSVDNLIKPLELAGIPYHLKENNDFLNQNEIKAMLLLFWYVMPYDNFKLNHLGDDFLNLGGFKDNDEFQSNHIFRLSDNTQNILFDIEKNYQHDLKKVARESNRKIKGYSNWYTYAEVFDLEDKVKKEIFDNIETFDIGLLDKNGLIELGITNEGDLDFFLKLNKLKSRIFSQHDKKLTTLKLFYELLNITDYFSEISIDNNPDDLKIKDNLALFSDIIKDYESIMGEYDFIGLFTYLNRVLKGYSCRHNDLDEGFNKVHLLSMHSAKGLEYPVVILGSLREGNCPLRYNSEKELYVTPNFCFEHKDNNEKIEMGKYDDEELRTIYVASTRAKEVLILSSIGKDELDVPDFLLKIKENSNTKIKLLEPDNLSIIPKVESSKVFKIKNDFPNVKFEDILDDFIYCPYRYDLANNTRFKVKLRNDKYVNMVLHKLLNSINNSSEKIDIDLINEKIDAIIKYHNISASNNAYDIINNVGEYWKNWGNNYKIVDSNIKILSRLKYCDLNSIVDLVIEEDNKFSVVHFIESDLNIPNIEMYKGFLLYYITILKDFDEYKDKEFNKVYLHSLENNVRHEIDYDEFMENYVLEYLDEFTKSIYDGQFEKMRDNCSNCEYYGSVCKG